MSEPKQTRREALLGFLRANPDDSFARYALALEYMNSGETDSAVAELRQLIARSPDYVPAHQQLGQLLARLERWDEARSALDAGIAAAQRARNSKALSEMETLLHDLPG